MWCMAQHKYPLTYLVEHELSGERVSQPHGELLAVPDGELLVGQHRAASVEVDVPLDLACHQGLVGRRVGGVHVPHPVRLALVQAVDVVEVRLGTVHLEGRKSTFL